jgi:cytochrome c oxidase subunit II
MAPDGVLHGRVFDHLLGLNLAILTAIFVLAHLILLIVMLRRRAAATLSPFWSNVFKFVPLLALCGLYVWMAATAGRLWAADRIDGPALTALQVEVVGVQFQWYFRYPGDDAVFGATRPRLVDAAGGNPLGIDPADPRGHDDFVSSVLVLPAGQEVDLRLRSQDVIHGFFIPAMRLKENAVPGLVLHVHFTPQVPGDYTILCSQICGLGHQRMQAVLRVLPPNQYKIWFAQHEYQHLHGGAQ